MLKGCIAAGIAVATMAKVVGDEEGKSDRKGTGKKAIKADLAGGAQGYHEWWVVPKITYDS